MFIDSYDVIVIGGGHAGCEAALATARMGRKTLLTAISLDSIAMMPCNPNIGGSSKGHLVREVDALGGEMGRNIDKTFIQTRMLNTSKGPAVYSLRAQADKKKYSAEMKKVLENTPSLTVRQTEITGFLLDSGRISGVKTESGLMYGCGAAVICTGTYVKARCLYGETIINSGPNGLRGAMSIGDELRGLGIKMFRFKTGTPARVDARSIHFDRMQAQEGDTDIVPFSFANSPADIARPQALCYLTYTNEETHRIIRGSLHRSPLYTGVIEGTGTRYCPSIEDKVVRFADKERHQVFIEPEGEDTNEMYVAGLSTSLPEDVQLAMYRTVPGLEDCSFTRTGYAIEYDCIDATQLTASLVFKKIPGLFSAGQFNGSSGYEEAAAQGLIAGINAALYTSGRDMIKIGREQGYIGVLIDDLVTKGSREPYRMMTSRAEYRLLLRQDNADLRLTEIGYHAGLVPVERYNGLLLKKAMIEQEIKRVCGFVLPPGKAVNDLLQEHGSSGITSGVRLSELIRRPELSYDILAELDTNRPELPPDVREQVNIEIKYEGYIKRQRQQIEAFKKLEDKPLPPDIDYSRIKGLRIEAQQKLSDIQPASIGQAGRIAGVSPADITLLMVYVK